MEPEFLEGPGADGRTVARRPSVQQLLLALALFVALFAVSFGASTLFGSGSTANVSDESAPLHVGEGVGVGAELGAKISAEDSVEGGETDALRAEDGSLAGSDESLPILTDDSEVATDETVDPGAPLLALVIDDWGYGWEAASDFLALQVPLNVAVIPHLPRSVDHARIAAQNGHQVILHLPMEPQNAAWDLGDGAVTTDMTDTQIAFEVNRAMDSIPYISGINNHMGSKATADERVVRAVLKAAKERGVFFLDSRTTPYSVIDKVATELGVPFLENDRFVDIDLNSSRVRDAILLAADTARRRGWAVAIGHVHRATYDGIIAALPHIRERGVRLALLSDILDQVNPGWDAGFPNSLP